MHIDSHSVRAVLDRMNDLDPYQSYYIKDSIRYESVGPFVLKTSSVLLITFAKSERVLGVCCGDGCTLRSNAELFGHSLPGS